MMREQQLAQAQDQDYSNRKASGETLLNIAKEFRFDVKKGDEKR